MPWRGYVYDANTFISDLLKEAFFAWRVADEAAFNYFKVRNE